MPERRRPGRAAGPSTSPTRAAGATLDRGKGGALATLASISVGLVYGDLLLAWIFRHLYAKERLPHLRYWAASWAVNAIASAAGGAQIVANGGKTLEGVAAVAILAQSLLLMEGTTALTQGRMSRWWWAAAPVSLACAATMEGLGLTWPLPMLAPLAFMAAATSWTGITVLRVVRSFGATAWLAGGALVLLGLHYLDFPFVADSPRFAPWGLMLTLAFRASLGAGFLMLHFEQARDGLAASEERYKHLFEDAIEGVFRTDPAGNIVDANPALADILGASRSELVGMNAFSFCADPADRERLLASDLHDVADLSWSRRDGTRVTVQLHCHAVRDEAGKILHYQGFVRDVTHARQLERQLFQAQRMETVGRLAGGIAHDFNNLLTIIGTSAELIASDGGRASDMASAITEATQRAAALTRQLLTFAGRERGKPEVLALAPVVAGMLQLLERAVGKGVELDLDVPDESLRTLVDRAQLEQVVMNLVLNARDAMPRGGRVSIRLRRAGPDDPKIPSRGRPFIVLEVRDTGEGIAPEALPHVFEPFFTTKEPGKGTGLGLATVYAIATQAGGSTDVESEPGKGTTFRIYLPDAQGVDTKGAPIVPAPPRPAASSPVPSRRRRTVLLVEDESGVRNVARQILEAAGHSVLVATDGAEAIARARQTAQLDVLLTDVVMPNIDGPTAAREILRLHPEVAVVFMSGYPERLTQAPYVKTLGARFLTKPFAAAELVAIVDGAAAKRREVATA